MMMIITSTTRNGLLTDHQIIEINGACVVGLSDRQIRESIEQGGEVVTFTIMQARIFRQILNGMSEWLVKNRMNHSYSS